MEGGSFEIVQPRSRKWKNVGRRWTKGVGGLENFRGRHIISSLNNRLYKNALNVFIFYYEAPKMTSLVLFLDLKRLTLKKISNIVLNLTNIHLFNVKNGNTRTMCEICSKLTVNTLERRHWRGSSIFIGSSE